MDGIKMVCGQSPTEINAYLRTFIKKPETLSDLLKLSAKDLYVTGKLEKLKKLSLEHYKLKYEEYFGIKPYDARLQELLKLSGRELYMQNKFEELKQLSPTDYQVKFNEFMNGYKAGNLA